MIFQNHQLIKKYNVLFFKHENNNKMKLFVNNINNNWYINCFKNN
jgi:hypothetical protein